MTRKPARAREFELIAKHFAPLARGATGALGLKDDAACLAVSPGCELVVTTDAVVEGVHFLDTDPPEEVARKALRVNLSDLAAKGARPFAWLLTLALPFDRGERWLTRLTKGFRADQRKFGVVLVGGDTVSTPGPLTLNVVALGEAPAGRMIRRDGAREGDDIWVSGAIGDAALGLLIAQGNSLGLNPGQQAALLKRYRRPEPRLALGQALPGLAHSCIDVSDGLVADLGHVAEASGLALRIDARSVPLSSAARAAMASGNAALSMLLTGGDDYELAFTAPREVEPKIRSAARACRTPVARIGTVEKGRGVSVVDASGKKLTLGRTGFSHF